MKQVIVNLLSNAIKYNKGKSSIKISVEFKNEYIRFNFIDTGIGLTISQEIVKKMGGTINVESVVNEGSHFWFDLPMSTKISTQKDTTDTSSDENNSELTDEKTEFTVIYIDDNPSNLKLVEQLLKNKKNINILTSLESTVALALFKENIPDLILLDLHMPKLDGYEVLRLIKNETKLNQIPVVAISASAMDDEVKRGLDSGFTQYITKPIDIKKFYAMIDDLLYKL